MALSSWRRRRRTPSPTTDAAAPPRSASPPALPATAAAPPSPSPNSPTLSRDTPRNALAFWLLGLANNSPYTIALAAANELAAGAVGSVFFAAVFPALLLKLSTPFWFPKVPVGARAAASALLALTAFPLLAAATKGGGEGGGTPVKAPSVLASIALLSLQGGLGEASALAAAGTYPHPRVVLGAWSSGTGAAGPAGFSFLMLFHVFAKMSLRDTMLLALVWPALWLISQFVILRAPPRPDAAEAAAAVLVVGGGEGGAGAATTTATTAATIELSPVSPSSRPLSAAAANRAALLAEPEEAQGLLTPRATAEAEEADEGDEERGRAAKAEGGGAAAGAAAAAAAAALPSSCSSGSPRWAATSLPRGFLATSAHVASLWPFAVPLFLVYFAGKGKERERDK